MPQDPYIGLIFLFLLVVDGPLSPFLSSMIYLMNKDEKKDDIFLLRAYSFMFPIRIT